MTERQRRFILGFLLLAAVGLLVVWAWLAMPPAEAGAGLPASADAASSGTAMERLAVAAHAAGASAASAALPASATASASAGAMPGLADADIPPEDVEACGAGRVSAEELRRWKADPAYGQAQAKTIEASMRRSAEAGLSRIAARLAAGSERQQVAARLLMGDRDGAAMLAERSSDAQAYQMALTACGAAREGAPHCAPLNPRRWAELDPTDARPWLRLMEAARRRKDAAGVDAALAEAAVRPRLSRGSWLLEAQAVAVADAAPDAAALGQALVAAIGMDAAMPGFDLAAPLAVCRGDGLRDPSRSRHCGVLARQVLAATTDLGEAAMAQKLAERAGVPREQQAHDAATLKEAQDLYLAHALESVGMDCAAMGRTHRLSADRAAKGDLAAALALLPPRKQVH